VQPPRTRYTRSGDVNIAYQVFGEGPSDLLWIPGFAQHVELAWEEPYRRRWLERLGSEYRVIVFDKRGTGLSDRVEAAPVEVRMDDCRAVLEAAESQRAVVFAAGDSADLAVVFAATYPERVIALALFDGQYRGAWAPDFPWAMTREELLRWIDDAVRHWPNCLYERIRAGAPSLEGAELEAFVRVLRLSVSPGAAAAFWRMNIDVDVRSVLSSVRVPTLVFETFRDGPGRWVAAHMPTAEHVFLDRPDHLPPVGDIEPPLRELRRVVEHALSTPVEPDTVLTTILFTDLVGSTARAAELGDRAWRSVLESHHAAVRAQLARYRGVEHDTAGDGFFASFDGPARAIRCACAIRDAVLPLGLEIRAGLHTGECEVLEEKMSGIAVAIGARVAAQATPSEVLVSQTVKDLVAGSGMKFDERGRSELKGVPGEWQLYAVAAG
jgi:class 3 adenylate cyclase